VNARTLRAGLLLISAGLFLGGCASARSVEQRTTQGPSAREMWYARMIVQNGREPSQDERYDWEDQIETKIGQYLNQHPEFASSLQVTSFRFDRRVAVGMSKEQVFMLLDAPLGITSDQAEMETLARRYWPLLKGNVTEAWVYPGGWNLYFAGSRLLDITQYDPGS
jgi:hypothetical protein